MIHTHTGLYICLFVVIGASLFTIGMFVRELIGEFKKEKCNRIIKEKGYLPIEMEKNKC